MSYIGRQRPTETTSSVLRSTYTGDGSTTTFNLPGPVANEISIIATINGVTQQDTAYTTNGSQIIFASAPANGDAIELRTISDVGLSYAPFAGSVTTGILADGAVTAGKLASGAAVANIGTRAIGVSQVPAGSVLQVVQSNLGTAVAINSTSLVDIGLSASITPTSSSSKILVLCSIQSTMNATAGGSWAGWYSLLRGSTQIADTSRQWTQSDASGNQAAGGVMSIIWLDSPATTSSTTYKLQAYVGNSSGTLTVNLGSVGESTITLMEIAA